MTTYWLLGDKSANKDNNQNVADDGAGPSTSFTGGNNRNPSITFQGPDSPAGHETIENGRTWKWDDECDEDDPQLQGACALPLHYKQGTQNANYDASSDEDELNAMCYQDSLVYASTSRLSDKLEYDRCPQEAYPVYSSDDGGENRSFEDDTPSSSPRDIRFERIYQREHDRDDQRDSDEDLVSSSYGAAGVICKGKVRATVLMFNERWQNDGDDNSKKHN